MPEQFRSADLCFGCDPFWTELTGSTPECLDGDWTNAFHTGAFDVTKATTAEVVVREKDQ